MLEQIEKYTCDICSATVSKKSGGDMVEATTWIILAIQRTTIRNKRSRTEPKGFHVCPMCQQNPDKLFGELRKVIKEHLSTVRP